MDRLPIFLNLRERPCLVVGGGVIAERKTRLLLRNGALITVLSPTVTKLLQQQIDQGIVSHLSQRFDDTTVANFWLIVAATDDQSFNRQIAFSAEAAGRFCNVVDDNEASTFILPAIVDRSPVIIAIGTEGNAPVLAQQLKAQIESWLPTRISELAKQAGRWRKLVKSRFRTLPERRNFWRRFFSGPIADHLLAGRQAAAEKAMRAELVGDITENLNNQGEAWIVGAGPGDPGLVTLRAQQLISQADVVLYDQLVSKPILDIARKEADMILVGKRSASKGMPQKQINKLLVDQVRKGKRVCRLKGGDPFIFGRGGEEALALSNAGLPFQIVPGISAAIGCAAYAGIPLTLRGISSGVTFTTARLDNGIAPDWVYLLNCGHTLAIYMGVGSIQEISTQLIRGGVPSDLPIALVENGTTSDQRTILSTISKIQLDAKNADISTPAMIYIGETVRSAEHLRWFDGQSGTGKFLDWADEEFAAVVG